MCGGGGPVATDGEVRNLENPDLPKLTGDQVGRCRICREYFRNRAKLSADRQDRRRRDAARRLPSRSPKWAISVGRDVAGSPPGRLSSFRSAKHPHARENNIAFYHATWSDMARKIGTKREDKFRQCFTHLANDGGFYKVRNRRADLGADRSITGLLTYVMILYWVVCRP